MAGKRYVARTLGIMAVLLDLLYAISVFSPSSREGVLLLTAGLLTASGVLLQGAFTRAGVLAGLCYLAGAGISLVFVNSIFTGLLPGFLGIAALLEERHHV